MLFSVNSNNFSLTFVCFRLQIGEAAKLKPMEVELKRLEDLSDAIVQDFSMMRKREEEMRDTNGNYCLGYVPFRVILFSDKLTAIFIYRINE